MSTAIAERTLFDEAVIPAEDRDLLRRAEDTIGQYARRMATDSLTIGTLLLEVQGKTGRYFEQWVESRTPFSLRTAYRMIAMAVQLAPVADIIREAEPKSIERCALHLIAAESTSPAARADAIAIIQAGEPLTFFRAKELVAAHRKAKGPSLFKECDEPPPSATPDDSRIIRVLQDLARNNGPVTLDGITDDDDPDDVSYTVSIIGLKTTSGRTLSEAVDRLTGHEPAKRCDQCFDEFVLAGMPVDEAKQKATKPLSFFVAKKGRKDGHASECKTCSRKRVSEAKKNRREAA